MKVLFLSLMAQAQQITQTGNGAPKQPGAIEMMLPFIFVFAIFYFLVIRPQVKRQKAHHKFVSELKKGDEVITSSGILGTIEGLTDRFVTLEIAEGVSIKVLRSQVASTLAQQQEVKN
ncbi:MAG: hypothetical protein RJB66_1132 [Pseudomonadota bacterium]|jgi:preprotein translocase subunit YajC